MRAVGCTPSGCNVSKEYPVRSAKVGFQSVGGFTLSTYTPQRVHALNRFTMLLRSTTDEGPYRIKPLPLVTILLMVEVGQIL